ncbi:MAG: NYN domain-containing protein [Hyphomicrobium sp.]|jgi:uncharacterized LabA/DUF88 family protein
MSTIGDERIGLFIDGVSLQHATNVLQMRLDFKRLLKMFQQRGRLIRANYYSVLSQPSDDTLKPLLDWLSYNGFNVVARNPRHGGDAENMLSLAVDISVDAMRLSGHLDHIVLFSACRELQSLVCALKTMGRRVSVVSTMRAQSVPDELRRAADTFLDLDDLRPIIAKEVGTVQQAS